jgi:hypothetical protein
MVPWPTSAGGLQLALAERRTLVEACASQYDMSSTAKMSYRAQIWPESALAEVRSLNPSPASLGSMTAEETKRTEGFCICVVYALSNAEFERLDPDDQVIVEIQLPRPVDSVVHRNEVDAENARTPDRQHMPGWNLNGHDL